MDHWFVAYIDPGAGSMVIQATLAALLAIPYVLRRQIARAVRSIGRLGGRSARTDHRADHAN